MFVGVREGLEQLRRLSDQLDALLLPDLGGRDKPFLAHLTLARLRDRFHLAAPLAQALHQQPFGDFQVNRVQLLQSHLSHEGARYEVIG
jgi:2'-5' RNA ligase